MILGVRTSRIYYYDKIAYRKIADSGKLIVKWKNSKLQLTNEFNAMIKQDSN